MFPLRSTGGGGVSVGLRGEVGLRSCRVQQSPSIVCHGGVAMAKSDDFPGDDANRDGDANLQDQQDQEETQEPQENPVQPPELLAAADPGGVGSVQQGELITEDLGGPGPGQQQADVHGTGQAQQDADDVGQQRRPDQREGSPSSCRHSQRAGNHEEDADADGRVADQLLAVGGHQAEQDTQQTHEDLGDPETLRLHLQGEVGIAVQLLGRGRGHCDQGRGHMIGGRGLFYDTGLQRDGGIVFGDDLRYDGDSAHAGDGRRRHDGGQRSQELREFCKLLLFRLERESGLYLFTQVHIKI